MYAGMKVCVVPSLLICGLQATHLLRLFNHNQDLVTASTRSSLFTVNNYFGPNSGNTNNGQSGQIATGGNNALTRQVIYNQDDLVSLALAFFLVETADKATSMLQRRSFNHHLSSNASKTDTLTKAVPYDSRSFKKISFKLPQSGEAGSFYFGYFMLTLSKL